MEDGPARGVLVVEIERQRLARRRGIRREVDDNADRELGGAVRPVHVLVVGGRAVGIRKDNVDFRKSYAGAAGRLILRKAGGELRDP